MEPDYRMSLAAERTALAYSRTGLALMAAGVAVAAALPDANAEVFRRLAGAVLVVLGVGVAVAGRRRYQAIDAAMRAEQPLPFPSAASWLAMLLVGVGALALIVVAFG